MTTLALSVEELIRLLRDQVKPGDELLKVRGLLVSRDVWAKLTAEIPPSEVATPSLVSWTVNVSPWAPPGTIIPVDAEGRPIERAVHRVGDGERP